MKRFIAALMVMAFFFVHDAAASDKTSKKSSAPVIELTGSAAIKKALRSYQKQIKTKEFLALGPAYRNQQITRELLNIWHANGYYRAQVEADGDESKQVFHSTPGELYHWGKIQYKIQGVGTELVNEPDIEAIVTSGLQTGKPALAGEALKVQGLLKKKLADDYCFFRFEVQHEVTINYLTQEVDMLYRINVGKAAYFGDTYFAGLKTLSEDYVRKLEPVKKGTCFKRSTLSNNFLAVKKSGFFTTVNMELPQEPSPDGTVDVTFQLKERAQHTVKAGANYSTDIGPGVTLGWEHRNFLSHGEKFNTDLSLTPVERSLSTQLEKPYFLRDDQTLKLGSVLDQEDSDAYRTTGLTLTAQIEHDFSDQWEAATGVSYGFKQIKDQQSTENFALLSFPSYATKDTRDNILDPKKGWTFRIETSPYVNTLDTGVTFLKSRLIGTYYKSAEWKWKPTLALRAATGSIAGVPTDNVPATERFFTGGGGSVRGYDYQKLGPLDSDNDPLGGRSFLESSMEIRLRLSQDYGFATFLDAGNTFDTAYPDFEEKLRFGTGLGLRYFTDFGPIRADIGVPLNKRKGIDDSFQLYFSIGQAF